MTSRPPRGASSIDRTWILLRLCILSLEFEIGSRAESRGTTLSELVNELLRKDIELIEAAK